MQNHKEEALGKRTRYYQSMIDIDSLIKGQDYSELKDSYILFICKSDPFRNESDKEYGLPCYTFNNRCNECDNVKLNDKTTKVIYNASGYKNEKDARIRALLHFICTNEPGEDDLSNRLSSLVEKIKENDKFRRNYAAMNLHDRDIERAAKKEGIAQGIAQGITQGAAEKAVEAASQLIKMGKLSLEEIAQATGLKTSQIENIKSSAGTAL
ncbi:MAG: Rpn family recombination-promoting nuclease/putative transposase [Treponema sp.]|nr:Rpn family recombination-promoting nuclease/putative transposase [Treponema sp.]